MSQKGFAAPLVLFLLLLATIGIAVISFKSHANFHINNSAGNQVTYSPQSKIKTYTDSDEGFHFEYPGSLSVGGDNEGSYDDRNGGIDYGKNFTQTYGYKPPSLVKGLLVKSDSIKDPAVAPFTLWIFDNPDNFSASRWYRNYWYYPFVWGEYEPQKSREGPDKEASVSGEVAYFATLGYRPQNPKFVYLRHKGKMYLFKIPTPGPGQPDIGNQILDSFKFN